MNILSLIKINFISIFKGMFGYGKKRQGRKFIVFALVILALMFYVFYDLMDTFMQYFVTLNAPEYILFMGAIMSFALVLFFITYESQNYFFKTKDFDLLASLPLKNSEIAIAKYTSVLLSAYIYASFIMLPSIVVYFSYVQFSFAQLLLQLLAFLFFSLVPMAIGTLLGLFISFLTSKLKHSNIISIILFLLLFVAYFVMFFYMNSFTSQIVASGEQLFDSMQYYLPSIVWYFKGFVQGDALNIVLFILLNILLTAIVITMLSLLYKKINYALIKRKLPRYKKVYTFTPKKSIPTFLTLEAKRFFSVPVYVLNACFSLLLMIAMPIILKFSLQPFFEITEDSVAGVSSILNILIFLNAMFTGMSNTTYASISIEGKQINTLKSLPIAPNKIYFSKILFNCILVLPFIVISGIISIALFWEYLNIFTIFMLFIIPTLSLLSLSTLGLILNLYMPKFDYDNINQIVKQSLCLIIIIVVDMVLAFVPMLTTNLVGNTYLMFGIMIAVYLIIFTTCFIILKQKGKSLYEKLSY